MTDTELVHRAEQAVLGAMIIQPERISRLSSPVTPDHFADPRHQAIFSALAGTSGKPRGLIDRLRGLFTRFSRQARETGAYMETLPEMCPDAGHVTSYVRMLGEARAEREASVREAGRRVAHATEILTDALRQLGQTGNVPHELPADVARLARAVSGKARHLAEAQPQPHVQPDRPQRQVQAAQPWSAPVAGAPAQQGGQRAVPRASNSAAVPQGAAPSLPVRIGSVQDLQDQVLAGLMRDPGEAQRVVEWLPAEAFRPGDRRELYTLITEFARNRDDMDPLTLAWDAERWGALGADDGALDPGFVLRMGALSTSASSSVQTLARMLLADHVCTTSFGRDWFHSPEVGRLATRTEDNWTAATARSPRTEAEPAQEKAVAAQAGPVTTKTQATGASQEKRPTAWRSPFMVGEPQGTSAPANGVTPAPPVQPLPDPVPGQSGRTPRM